MKNELKQVTVGEREFSVVKLEPWKRLTFLADFQKEFLVPALNNVGVDSASALFDPENQNTGNLVSLISGFSSLIDGKSLELWTKRIFADGLVIYTRDDGQRAKMAFSEIDKLFTNPTDIIMLLKEVIQFNMDDMGSLLGKVTGQTGQITEV